MCNQVGLKVSVALGAFPLAVFYHTFVGLVFVDEYFLFRRLRLVKLLPFMHPPVKLVVNIAASRAFHEAFDPGI